MTAIAIDFGTSRTKLACRNARGEARLLRFKRGEAVPSGFYLPHGSDALLWGDDAMARVEEDPVNAVEVPKRKLRDPRIRANEASDRFGETLKKSESPGTSETCIKVAIDGTKPKTQGMEDEDGGYPNCARSRPDRSQHG